MYEKMYGKNAGGDLYRLQYEARRRMGEKAAEPKMNKPFQPVKDEPTAAPIEEKPVLAQSDFVPEAAPQSTEQKEEKRGFLAGLKNDDLLILGIIALLINEKADLEIIILLILILIK